MFKKNINDNKIIELRQNIVDYYDVNSNEDRLFKVSSQLENTFSNKFIRVDLPNNYKVDKVFGLEKMKVLNENFISILDDIRKYDGNNNRMKSLSDFVKLMDDNNLDFSPHTYDSVMGIKCEKTSLIKKIFKTNSYKPSSSELKKLNNNVLLVLPRIIRLDIKKSTTSKLTYLNEELFSEIYSKLISNWGEKLNAMDKKSSNYEKDLKCFYSICYHNELFFRSCITAFMKNDLNKDFMDILITNSNGFRFNAFTMKKEEDVQLLLDKLEEYSVGLSDYKKSMLDSFIGHTLKKSDSHINCKLNKFTQKNKEFFLNLMNACENHSNSQIEDFFGVKKEKFKEIINEGESLDNHNFVRQNNLLQINVNELFRSFALDNHLAYISYVQKLNSGIEEVINQLGMSNNIKTNNPLLKINVSEGTAQNELNNENNKYLNIVYENGFDINNFKFMINEVINDLNKTLYKNLPIESTISNVKMDNIDVKAYREKYLKLMLNNVNKNEVDINLKVKI